MVLTETQLKADYYICAKKYLEVKGYPDFDLKLIDNGKGVEFENWPDKLKKPTMSMVKSTLTMSQVSDYKKKKRMNDTKKNERMFKAVLRLYNHLNLDLVDADFE